MADQLEKIFHENYSSLCNFAAVMIKDVHQAEDIVQSVFVKLWENDQILGLHRPESYLLKCVKFKCIDFIRSKKRSKEVLSGELPEIGSIEPLSMTEEDIEPLLTYFAAKLPPKTRRVFLMSRKQGMRYQDIADELGVSAKTVENQMGNALKMMRKLLKDHQYFYHLLFFL